jgi:hypothetical protein
LKKASSLSKVQSANNPKPEAGQISASGFLAD